MSGGYVKLWRLSLKKPIFQNAQLWQFACWCLLKATHKPLKQVVGLQVVDLKPGQFVMVGADAAKELCSTPRKIRTCQQKLHLIGFLTRKSTNKYTVITVVNWDSYQADEPSGDKRATNGRQTNDKQTPSYHLVQEYKEEEEEKKKIKKKRSPPAFSPPTGEDLKIENPWLNPKAWDEFIQHRADKKDSLKSVLGVTKNLNVLSGYNAMDQQRIVDNTIANNWTGLFPLKSKGKSISRGDKTSETARLVKALRERREQRERESETGHTAVSGNR